ncbi:EAL domain-containing protein [Bosea sp. 2RAB26]
MRQPSGVSLTVDDFGTGYASLSYLARYPLDRLKIDKSFVIGMPEAATRDDTAMVRSIIAMAHNLKLEVIAEGVETASQAAFLRSEGCEEAQGFLYSPALEEAEFREFLAARLSTTSPLIGSPNADLPPIQGYRSSPSGA